MGKQEPRPKGTIALFDDSIPEGMYSQPQLCLLLDKHCKRWCFQLEKGEKNGYMHWQVRFSLKVRLRYSTILQSIKKKSFWIGGHITPTSNPTYWSGDMFYVMKEDTRVSGPWSDKDDKKVLTQQLEWFVKQKLRPFQTDIIEQSQIFDMRTIDLIWDTTGCCGKSLLSEYMEYEGLAEEIPAYRLMDDIFQWVATRPIKKSYIIDLPRGMKKDRLGDFYSGIEVIKNGVAFDKRNRATKVRFSRPRIFVFTNILPDFKLMSDDRWVIWKILPDFTAIKFTAGNCPP